MIRRLTWGLGFYLLLAGVPALALAPAGINVDSSLNQPLEAHIPLHNATAGQLMSLRVSQSGAATGLSGNRLRFRVENDASGRPVLWLTTAAPVKEPALSFVLEFAWEGGQLSREYTILLDPR